MATTPLYKWPYPIGTDLIMQGDDAIKALALAVENEIKPAYARLGATGLQQIPSAAWTLLGLTAKEVRDCTVAAGRITVARAGLYAVAGGCPFQMPAAGNAYLQLYVNGAQQSGRSNASGSTGLELVISRLFALNAGDVVDLRGYCSAAGTTNLIYTAGAEMAWLEIARLCAVTPGVMALPAPDRPELPGIDNELPGTDEPTAQPKEG